MNFEDWWRQFPRKTAKHAARLEWDRMTDEEKARAVAVMPLQARAWAGKDKQYIPHARTWLHQKRYLDDEFETEGLQTDAWLEALNGRRRNRQAVQGVSHGMGRAEDGGGVSPVGHGSRVLGVGDAVGRHVDWDD